MLLKCILWEGRRPGDESSPQLRLPDTLPRNAAFVPRAPTGRWWRCLRNASRSQTDPLDPGLTAGSVSTWKSTFSPVP